MNHNNIEKISLLKYIKKLLPKKKKNLFEILFEHPNYGIGEKVTRSIWRRPNTYWTITKFKPTLLQPEMKRGEVWGIFTIKGVSDNKEKRIRSSCKREWHFYDENFYKKFENPKKWIQNQHFIGGIDSKKITEEFLKKKLNKESL